MPPDVALENRANATFMAIAIRLDVLNGSSSYKMIKIVNKLPFIAFYIRIT